MAAVLRALGDRRQDHEDAGDRERGDLHGYHGCAWPGSENEGLDAHVNERNRPNRQVRYPQQHSPIIAPRPLASAGLAKQVAGHRPVFSYCASGRPARKARAAIVPAWASRLMPSARRIASIDVAASAPMK